MICQAYNTNRAQLQNISSEYESEYTYATQSYDYKPYQSGEKSDDHRGFNYNQSISDYNNKNPSSHYHISNGKHSEISFDTASANKIRKKKHKITKQQTTPSFKVESFKPLNSVDCGGQALFNGHKNPSNTSEFNIDGYSQFKDNNYKYNNVKKLTSLFNL